MRTDYSTWSSEGRSLVDSSQTSSDVTQHDWFLLHPVTLACARLGWSQVVQQRVECDCGHLIRLETLFAATIWPVHVS